MPLLRHAPLKRDAENPVELVRARFGKGVSFRPTNLRSTSTLSTDLSSRGSHEERSSQSTQARKRVIKVSVLVSTKKSRAKKLNTMSPIERLANIAYAWVAAKPQPIQPQVDAQPRYSPGVPYGLLRNRMNPRLSALKDADLDDRESMDTPTEEGIGVEMRETTNAIEVDDSQLRETLHEYKNVVSLNSFGFQALTKALRRDGATRIQSQVRVFLTIRSLAARAIQSIARVYLEKRQDSSLKIQRVYSAHYKKRYFACEQVQRFYKKRHLQRVLVATRVQCLWRRFVVIKWFPVYRKSTDTIRSVIREYVLFKRTKVTMIQTRVRAWIHRDRYIRQVRGFSRLQAVARKAPARKEYLRLLQAVNKMQWIRREKAAASSMLRLASRIRIHRKEHDQRVTAAKKIQSWCRRCAARHRFDHFCKGKMTVRRVLLRYTLEKRAKATAIQKTVRKWIAHTSYSRLKRATGRLQSLVRRRPIRRDYKFLLLAVVKVQQQFRGKTAGKSVRRLVARVLARRVQAACKIQSVWRMRRVRRHFVVTKAMLSCFQTNNYGITAVSRSL